MTPLTWSLVLAAAGAADGGSVFPPDARAREDALVRSFGLVPPDGGVLPAGPVASPDPRAWLVPAARHAERPPDQVDPAALRADLPALGAALEQGYVGHERAVKRGWRWALWLKEWDTLLEPKRGPLKLGEAFSMLDQVRELQPDGLTGLVSDPSRWRSLTATLETAPRGACAELLTLDGRLSELVTADASTQPRAALLLKDRGRALESTWMMVAPEPLGPLKQLHCIGGDLEAFSVWNPPPPARLALVKALGGTDGAGLKELEPRVWWVRPSASVDLSKLPADGVVLVDLRQLGGAAGGEELLKALGAPANLQWPQVIRRQSCAAAVLRYGALQALELSGRPHPLPEAQPVVSALQPGACRDVMEKRGGVPPRRGRPSLKPRAGRRVVVLADNGCEGTCELLAFQLSFLPDAVLAGTSTAGRAEYAEAGRLLLPRTRVPFQIALTRRELFHDRRSFDGYGLPPDVVIEDEEGWAPDSIRAFARSLLPPEKAKPGTAKP